MKKKKCRQTGVRDCEICTQAHRGRDSERESERASDNKRVMDIRSHYRKNYYIISYTKRKSGSKNNQHLKKRKKNETDNAHFFFRNSHFRIHIRYKMADVCFILYAVRHDAIRYDSLFM